MRVLGGDRAGVREAEERAECAQERHVLVPLGRAELWPWHEEGGKLLLAVRAVAAGEEVAAGNGFAAARALGKRVAGALGQVHPGAG